MSNAPSIFAIGVVAAISASCANNPPGGATAESAAAQRDYQLLSGTWQLTRAVDKRKTCARKRGAKYDSRYRSQHVPIAEGHSCGNVFSRALHD